jgi:hypothetical protein
MVKLLFLQVPGELSMLRHLSATDPRKLIFLPTRYLAVM